jgi:hypothetical protein
MQMFLIDGGCCSSGPSLDLPHTWALVEAIHTNQSFDRYAKKGSLIHISYQLAASSIAAANWLRLRSRCSFFIFAMSKVESKCQFGRQKSMFYAYGSHQQNKVLVQLLEILLSPHESEISP